MRRPRSVNPPSSEVLPWDVRYALQHRDATLGPAEIELLLRSKSFGVAGLYLAMKYADGKTDDQTTVLQNVAESHLKGIPEYTAAVTLLSSNGPQISATKLFHISRYGTKNWRDAFEAQLDQTANSDQPVYVVAYAGLSGFEPIMNATLGTQKPLHILFKPKSVNKPLSVAGFKLERSGESVDVSVLDSSFEKPPHAFILDDVMSTGNTKNIMEELWNGTPIDFHAAVTVGS